MSKSNNNTILYVGLAGAAAYFLLSKKTGTGTSVLSTSGDYPYLILPGHPTVPGAWDYQYYLKWIYPAMIQSNPAVGDSNHIMSAAESQQYLSNYSDLRGAIPSMVPKVFSTQQAFLQDHWKHNAVAESRTFLPFLPTTTAPYTPPPANANSSGGTPWYSTALSIAGSLIAFAGTEDFESTDPIQSTAIMTMPRLNDLECEILIAGAAIALDILPFYYGQPGSTALIAEDRIKAAVHQYTR